MKLHDFPVLLTVACFALSCAVVFLTDIFAMPAAINAQNRTERTWRRRLGDFAVRIPVIALIFAFFFAISWRPIYSSQAVISFFVIFTGISRAKFEFIREPLVFSDIALVVDVFKYKEIFYATSLNIFFWIIAFAYVFGLSGLYMYWEPAILPARNGVLWVFLMFAVAIAPWLALFSRIVSEPVCRFTQKYLVRVDVKMDTVRFGTFASVVFHFVIWVGVRREAIVADLSGRLISALHELWEHGDEEPLIVVWQSESFIDLRHFGVESVRLPNLDRLREQAAQWGRMSSVFEGGYTLRTEFAVLSGLLPENVHIDASYPYLRASHYKDVVWPARLKKAGWKTQFIHPYDKTFFLRHKAMPQLGFDRMMMLDEFDHNSERDGPYVSDQSLTKSVIRAIDEDGTDKNFVFVASMANHGPWEPGRCGDLVDPVDIYAELLMRADHALGNLAHHLDRLDRPVWLLFYGDHAPLLKAFADPFPDPRTDYVIVPLGRARAHSQKPTPPQEEAPWNFIGAMLRYAGLSTEVPE
ncbi:LTA synthase family protein [Rhizobium freirei]|uniref:LTA synthase family protein n=1 Tax=Rhizobium freirei TaxID=1353277 RepID=UPI00039AA969|nr:LTA synthase family protein [Rhizobium freirei]